MEFDGEKELGIHKKLLCFGCRHPSNSDSQLVEQALSNASMG